MMVRAREITNCSVTRDLGLLRKQSRVYLVSHFLMFGY